LDFKVLLLILIPIYALLLLVVVLVHRRFVKLLLLLLFLLLLVVAVVVPLFMEVPLVSTKPLHRLLSVAVSNSSHKIFRLLSALVSPIIG
jgi:hypothetical protein